MAKTPPLRFNEYTQEYTLTAEEKADYEEAKRRAYAGLAPKTAPSYVYTTTGTKSATAAYGLAKPRDASMDVVEAIMEASIYPSTGGVVLRTRGKDIHIPNNPHIDIGVQDCRSYIGTPLGTVRDFLLYLAEKSKEA